MENKYLRGKDLEKAFGVNRSTLWHWRNKGLPHYNINGQVYYKEMEVAEWVEKHRVSDN